jgi:hypothetical protein
MHAAAAAELLLQHAWCLLQLEPKTSVHAAGYMLCSPLPAHLFWVQAFAEDKVHDTARP